MQPILDRRKTSLQNALQNATHYHGWREAALELDYLEGNMEWKDAFRSRLYAYELVYDRLNLIKSAREKGQHQRLIHCLREGLDHDVGNIINPALYRRCRVGTKHLIEQYVEQVCSALVFLSETEFPDFNLREKYDFFKDLSLSFGRPSLLLSGGATLGLFHIGVVKALWERGVLPNVISGSSAGAIMAAMLGSYTDDELPRLFDPTGYNLSAWRWIGLLSGVSGNGFMDINELESCLRENIGDYTFLESYQRTGRSINISVSPVQKHQDARLLSGYTSPYLLIWSAALASSAVPAIFPPVQLMKRDETGSTVAFMPKLRWVDGSVVSDLPIKQLTHLYNVNFSIVSQTNPHIVPFLRDPYKMPSRGKVRDIPWRALKSELKFHGTVLFDYLRQSTNVELLRQGFGQAYSILAQRYAGDITIAPRYRLWHYSKILKNPDKHFIKRMILEGERATWPMISVICTHAKISRTLQKATAALKDRVVGKRPKLTLIDGARTSFPD